VVLLHFLLRNPDRPSSVCIGELNFRLERTQGGIVTVAWTAQEFEDRPGGACSNVGPRWEGQAAVESRCCQQVVDITLPRAAQTYRTIFRTDWNVTIDASAVDDVGAKAVRD
jgi:hypothetical protein